MKKIIISVAVTSKVGLLFLLIFVVSVCAPDRKKDQKPFPVLTISDDEEWVTYEGKWLTNGGIIRFELSLKSGAFGQDSYYQLHESFESDSLASGSPSRGLYSTYEGFPNKELGIRLHDVNPLARPYLRFKSSSNVDAEEQMFFITRGNDELLPCDDNFNPLTTDRRYTLHRRSKLFTVEGYFTLEQEAGEFFERNTGENWVVTDLGEFSELTLGYKKLVKEKYQGIYLKALAYSVSDTTSTAGKNTLVIKRIKSFGNDPDQ